MKPSDPLMSIPVAAGTPSLPAAPRAARFPEFIGGKPDLPALLDRLSVAIVGTGAVGGAAALDLARMQIGRLILIDGNAYKNESVTTQPIGPEAVGQPKARHLGERCKAISPATKVQVFEGSVEGLDPVALRQADAILLATDNLSAEVAAGQLAIRLGIPLLQASVHGETLVAQVRTFGNRDGAGPCPACLFNKQEWSQLAREVTYACDAGSSPGEGRRIEAPPTVSIASLCGLAGHLAVIHLLRLAGGLGKPVEDTIYEYCGYTGAGLTAPLQRNPACHCDHQTWEFQKTASALTDATLAGLTEAAALPAGPNGDDPVFQVDGHDWVGGIECLAGHRQDWSRFVPRVGPSRFGPCPECGGCRHASPLTRDSGVAVASAASALRTPLGGLGVTGAGWVRLRTAHRTVAFH